MNQSSSSKPSGADSPNTNKPDPPLNYPFKLKPP